VNRSPSNSFNRPGILAEIPGDLFGNIEIDLHCPAFFLIIAHTDKQDLSSDWLDRIALSERLQRGISEHEGDRFLMPQPK